MNERRLFFAIPLSDSVRKRLAREMRNWEELPVIPERSDFLHVTVLFLGHILDEDVAELSDIAREVCASHEPFELFFSGIGLGPDAEEPKTICLAGEESEALRDLRNGLVEEFSGRLVGSRRFRPHVTLAKVKRGAFMRLSKEEQNRAVRTFPLSEPVSSVVLFESVGTGPKREYLPMKEFPLGETDNRWMDDGE